MKQNFDDIRCKEIYFVNQNQIMKKNYNVFRVGKYKIIIHLVDRCHTRYCRVIFSPETTSHLKCAD